MVLKGVLSLGFLCVVSRLIDCVEHKTRLCASCAHANFLPTFQKLRWRSESGIFLNFAMMWLAPACETAAGACLFGEKGGHKVGCIGTKG